MKIRVNLQIFLFAIIFIITKQIQIYGYIMLFAFIHELSHMLAGILLKLKAKTLQIMPFGISITFETYNYAKLTEKKKIIIASAGPFVNLAISIIFIFINSFNNYNIIIYSNLLVAFFNLIPIYPLDGGRILKSIIKMNYKNETAEKYVNLLSNIILIIITAFSSILILYIKNISILFIIIYLWILRIRENKRFIINKRAYGVLLKANKTIDN